MIRDETDPVTRHRLGLFGEYGKGIAQLEYASRLFLELPNMPKEFREEWLAPVVETILAEFCLALNRRDAETIQSAVQFLRKPPRQGDRLRTLLLIAKRFRDKSDLTLEKLSQWVGTCLGAPQNRDYLRRVAKDVGLDLVKDKPGPKKIPTTNTKNRASKY